MDDELNRFVEQKQKELFAKIDVLCALVNITMSHDTNFVYFGVFKLADRMRSMRTNGASKNRGMFCPTFSEHL